MYSSPDVEGQVQGDVHPIPSSPYSALPSGPGSPTTAMPLHLPQPQPTPTASPLPGNQMASLPAYRLTYFHNLCLANCHGVRTQFCTPLRTDICLDSGWGFGKGPIKTQRKSEIYPAASYLQIPFSGPIRQRALSLVQAFCCSLVPASRVFLDL